MTQTRTSISIVCPAFNEADGIGSAIGRLRDCIDALGAPAEVLIINDGSSDGTAAAALRAIGGDTRFRVFSHKANFGRGRAIRTGFHEASGDIVVTTEGDLSWGADVIARMVKALEDNPGLDAVFASPHLPGGGYRNVPWHRILLSKWGNVVLRTLYPSGLSMTTGMTRAYRAAAIQGRSFTNDGKELHLEIAHRLLSLGHAIGEVPAVLSWPGGASGQQARGKRTDWTKIRRLVASHLAFGILQGIERIIAPSLAFLSVAIAGFGMWAVYNALRGAESIFLVILTGLLLIIWMNLAVGYFMFRHVFHIETDVWRLDQMMSQLQPHSHPASRQYYDEESREAAGSAR